MNQRMGLVGRHKQRIPRGSETWLLCGNSWRLSPWESAVQGGPTTLHSEAPHSLVSRHEDSCEDTPVGPTAKISIFLSSSDYMELATTDHYKCSLCSRSLQSHRDYQKVTLRRICGIGQ